MREQQKREEAGVRNRRLIKSFDERELPTRDWWMRAADRRDELMLLQIFHMVNDSHRGPDKPSVSHPD